MRTTLSGLGLGVGSMLLTAVAAFGQLPAYTDAGPVPSVLLAAKTIFVSNAGSDGLFPDTFSGDSNRAYTEFYAALKSSGKYKLVDDPAQADLVLELRLIVPMQPNPGKEPDYALPTFRLVIYDRKSHYILWTVIRSIDGAYLRSTHDRNFDNALNAVLAEFLRISGKAQ
jgi:hypothetical protein